MMKKEKSKVDSTIHLKEDVLKKMMEAQSDGEIDDILAKSFCIPFDRFKFKSFEKLIKDVIEIQYKEYFELKIRDSLRTKKELIVLSPSSDGKKMNSVFFSDGEIKKRGEAVKKMLLKNYYDHFGSEEKLFKIIHAALFAGSKLDLMKLIEYDKSWLYTEYVKYLILRSQAKDDRNFFELLSGAMQLKRKSRLKAKSNAIEKVLEFIDFYCNRKLYSPIKVTEFKLSDLDTFYELIHKLIYVENCLKLNCKELDEINILNSKEYFKQYIKRKIQNDPVGLI